MNDCETKNLRLVNKYIDYRTSSNVEGVLSLCSDDIFFIDAYGKEYKGKVAFSEYLKSPTPTSEWYKPVVLDEGVLLKGRVYKMFMWWHVSAEFKFNDNKISMIILSKE